MRDLCNKIKALSALFVFGLGLAAFAAAPTVTSVTAQQRYPWNGLVDIVVTISGEQGEVAEATCTFVATNSTTKTALSIVNVTQVGEDSGSGSTWIRRFIWDTNADVGEVKISDVELVVEVGFVEGVQLWEGGPYWAKCNVGASKPEEYGSYFWWGDTVGYKPNGDQFGSGSEVFGIACPTCVMTESELRSLGYIDSTGNLTAAHDAATAHLGAPWRMPTPAEFYVLFYYCDAQWVNRNGVNGRLVMGRGDYASNSIFFPAAGMGSGVKLLYAGSDGNYWSSAPDLEYFFAGFFGFRSTGSASSRWAGNRFTGMSVRAVRNSDQEVCRVSSTASTHFALDNRMVVRVADEMERISFSPVWETELAGAIAIVSTNGVVLNNATEAGAYDWTPTEAGTYQFTHTVYVNGVQVGETLTATFVVSGIGMRPISADWNVGSITLKATGVSIEDGEDVWLSYRDANSGNGSWEYVDNFSQMVDDIEKSIRVTDTGFSSRLGGIPPVKYRLQIGKSKDVARVTLCCMTRTRHGLFVGYDAYMRKSDNQPWQDPLGQSLSDATELRRLCVATGGFMSDNAKLLSNLDATAQGIRDTIGYFAGQTKPGDLFAFYIATHGGDYKPDKKARLCAYDDYYYIGSLQEDVRKFSPGVAFVGIIMACHSQAMLGVTSTNEEVNAWLSNCGFDQCLGNVAWIASCLSSEKSYNSLEFSLFGQSFIRDGLRNGYADARLYGVSFGGVQYNGGNSDGIITLGELGRYVGAFAVGVSDKKSSAVQLENEWLLDRIVIRDGVTYTHLNLNSSFGRFVKAA